MSHGSGTIWSTSKYDAIRCALYVRLYIRTYIDHDSSASACALNSYRNIASMKNRSGLGSRLIEAKKLVLSKLAINQWSYDKYSWVYNYSSSKEVFEVHGKVIQKRRPTRPGKVATTFERSLFKRIHPFNLKKSA